MSILLVGGDRLGNITRNLIEYDFKNIEHISGRKNGDKKLKISPKTDLVLLLVDYVGHQLIETVKQESRKSDVKIVFSKRSWTYMENTIKEYARNILNNRKGLI